VCPRNTQNARTTRVKSGVSGRIFLTEWCSHLKRVACPKTISLSCLPYYYTSETCFLSKVLLDNEPFRLVSEFCVFRVFRGPSDGCGGAALDIPWAHLASELNEFGLSQLMTYRQVAASN
jgi:hypothetical protein